MLNSTTTIQYDEVQEVSYERAVVVIKSVSLVISVVGFIANTLAYLTATKMGAGDNAGGSSGIMFMRFHPI